MFNLAGHKASIFLYRFVFRVNGISFVVNESIAEDFYQDTDGELRPLVESCSIILLRYRNYCSGDTVMDGHILLDGDFEVMLEPGLGRYFDSGDKHRLFHAAHQISNVLLDVIERRSIEIEQGTYPGPNPVVSRIDRLYVGD